MIHRACRLSRYRTTRLAASLRLGILLPGLALVPITLSAITPSAACATPSSAFANHPYASHVTEASQRFGIPELWIWAVMRQESGGNSRARSSVGAMGLMQIMPGTWSMLTTRFGLGSDPFDIRANIHGGAAYLRMMWDRYGDVSLMLAAYNAGPGRADDYVARRRGLPTETVNYVARIAPSLGTSGIAPPAAVPSFDAPSWRRSALFTSRDEDNSNGNDAHRNAQPIRTSAASTVPSSLPSHPLFVPLSGRNE